MDELDLLFALIKGIWWLVRAVLRLATWPLRALLARTREPALPRAAPPKRQLAARPAPRQPRIDDLADLVRRVKTLDSSDLRAEALTRADTQRFVVTLDAMAQRLERLGAQLRRKTISRGDAMQALSREQALSRMVTVLVNERQSELHGLLLDTDALSNASYAPIVQFCGDRGIALASNRAATVIDGDKLFFLSVDDPSGLAAIVLPSSFSTSIMTWPAIAHEIGHDFFNSVAGLPRELRAALRLGDDLTLPPTKLTRAHVATIPEHAVAAWMEELFADAFGTMMLGPAFIETMMTSFQSPDDPGTALAAQSLADRDEYEEHPPGHVRVVAGCRLLARMGYGKEADALEARWRALHRDPSVVFVPVSDRRWLELDEEPVIARASDVGTALYLEGLPSLRGQPLRSIAGLDFGPREHQLALRHARRFCEGQAPEIGDARLLIAAAVLATVQAPRATDSIYALARNAIGDVDVPPEMIGGVVVRGAPDLAQELRDAFVFGELIAPPLSRR